MHRKIVPIAALAVAACCCRIAAADGTVVGVASAGRTLSTFGRAVQSAGLAPLLAGKGPFTVFAPTDAAFEKMPKSRRDTLMTDRRTLIAVLSNHVVPSKVDLAALAKRKGGGTVKTMAGTTLRIGRTGGISVNGARVLGAPLRGSNGAVHAIDTVLLPPGK